MTQTRAKEEYDTYMDRPESLEIARDMVTGVLATPDSVSDESIKPSAILNGTKFDPIFTHVVWYNK